VSNKHHAGSVSFCISILSYQGTFHLSPRLLFREQKENHYVWEHLHLFNFSVSRQKFFSGDKNYLTWSWETLWWDNRDRDGIFISISEDPGVLFADPWAISLLLKD
jgi:hypothetical protein